MIEYILQSYYDLSIVRGIFNTLEEAIRAGEKQDCKQKFLVFEISRIKNTRRLVFESMN